MKWILASFLATVIASASTAQAGVYWDSINDEVEITCGNGNDYVNVYGDAWSIQVEINGVLYGPYNSNERITVKASLNAGNDVLYYIDILNVASADQPEFDIFCGAGDDFIVTGEQHDVVWGGDGKDTIWTFGGSDSVNGEGGDDTVKSGAGSDNVNGGETYETNGDSLDQGGSADGYVTGFETITNPSP